MEKLVSYIKLNEVAPNGNMHIWEKDNLNNSADLYLRSGVLLNFVECFRIDTCKGSDFYHITVSVWMNPNPKKWASNEFSPDDIEWELSMNFEIKEEFQNTVNFLINQCI